MARMSRLPRYALNLALFLVFISGEFSLKDFIEIVDSGRSLKKILVTAGQILYYLVVAIVINGANNIRGLFWPFSALITITLWLIFGHSCEACDEVYKIWLSAPSNNVFSCIWYFVTTVEHQVLFVVINLTAFRLAAQWGTFLYFVKLHKAEDNLRPKKNACTVILPMADTEQQRFEECLTSCLLNKVHGIIIVTSSDTRLEIDGMMDRFRKRFTMTRIGVAGTDKTGKCDMIIEGIRLAQTEIIVLIDTSVFWPYYFMDRLLVSLNGHVGFAMIQQQVRRFRLPFKEVFPPAQGGQSESTIEISSGKEVARAIACQKGLLQHPDFRASFKRAQPADSTSYDENRAAQFFETWALEKRSEISKEYSGQNAIEPPARTTPESNVWTHRLFHWYRYTRQAVRMRLGYLLVTATRWKNLPYQARTSHGPAFFILAFVVDGIISSLIMVSPHPNLLKLRVLGDVVFGSEITNQIPFYTRGVIPLSEAIKYTLFVWLHGRIRIWALIYLCFNIFGETAMFLGNNDRDNMSGSASSPPSPPPAPSDPEPSDSYIQPSQQIVAGYEQPANARSSTPPRTGDPIQRVRNDPTYSPGSPPSRRDYGTQTSPPERSVRCQAPPAPAARAQSPSSPVQTHQESPRHPPNAPNEASRLREQVFPTVEEGGFSFEEPCRRERQRASRSLSPTSQDRPESSETAGQRPQDEPSRPETRRRAARRQGSNDTEYRPSVSDQRSPSIQGSHEDASRDGGLGLHRPNFTPSRRASSHPPPSSLSQQQPVLGSPLRRFPPPVNQEPQRPPERPARGEGNAPERTVRRTIEPIPSLPPSTSTAPSGPPEAESPAPAPKAKSKAKRAQPKPSEAPVRRSTRATRAKPKD
ncbi:hypothetical protein P170DRAFT_489166 [Aspergillus steynii IBT 23096]|uniref:Uncharacterized protein n=1 Tax=Aspergillus steynii IBT 23096 TaxID=1392250 RepID=A0A2I2GHY0_9EURO|nr:uncharacterized protein P170DRAFT_489166 [Aspergillus steynii IBT 23096]PLB52488.1 hypothetical protein P170DRAFT_489166 [Aspergillus steynii IBT 23096]